MKQGSAVTYLHGDHLGNTSATSGAINSSSTYYPFGAVRSGTLPTDYTFTGQKNDASSALMFYNARYYDANIGRFTQADTIVPNLYNPQSLNRYAYVLNNPMNYTDPTGHRACQDHNDCESGSGMGSPNAPVIIKNENTLVELSRRAPQLLLTLNFNLAYTSSNRDNRLTILVNVGTSMILNGANDATFLIEITRLAAMLIGEQPPWVNATWMFVDDVLLVTEGWDSMYSVTCGYDANRCSVYPDNLGRLLDGQTIRTIGGGKGFKPEYQDPEGWSNQVGHFWEYVGVAYFFGERTARWGNEYHERPGAGGASQQDLNLGYQGARLGTELLRGIIRLRDVPDWIRRNIVAP